MYYYKKDESIIKNKHEKYEFTERIRRMIDNTKLKKATS